MQDVQKFPKFYPSYGNLAKKERKRQELDRRLTTRICIWMESKENPPERPDESFSDLSCMVQLITQHPA